MAERNDAITEYLKKVKGLLDHDGWTQRTLASGPDGNRIAVDSEEARQFSLSGAIARVGRNYHAKVKTGVTVLVEQGIRHGTKKAMVYDLRVWNDDPKRTKAQVLAAVDFALRERARVLKRKGA